MRHLVLGALTAATILLADCTQGDTSSAVAKPVTVFALRHAEKVDDPQNSDPELTPEGQRRAEALARLLGSSGITHLFASEFRRTQATITPLAEAVGLEITQISAGSMADQIEALRALPAGSIAVVAGHSNTIPQIVARLGGEVGNLTRRGFIEDDTHDRLFIVTLPVTQETATQTVELRY